MSTHGERVNLLDRRGERHAAVTLSRGLLTEFGPGTTGVPVVSRDGSLVAAGAGGTCVYFNGTVGGLMTPLGIMPTSVDGDVPRLMTSGLPSGSSRQPSPSRSI